MAKFVDAAGGEWVLRINVSTIRRVKQAIDEDLTKIVDGDMLARIAGDTVLFGDILWCLVADQAAERKISNDQFFERLEGDALEVAATAFVDALVDFFPKPRRELLRKMVDAGKEVQKVALETARAALDEGLREFHAGKLSTSLPAASASTPAPSPSEN